MLVKSPFLSGAYTSRSRLLAAQACINLYPETVETQQGKEVGAFYGCPGLVGLADIDTGPWRGLHTVASNLIGVSGNGVYLMTGIYAATRVGQLASNVGPVCMVDNGFQVLITDGANAYGYSLQSGTFAQIALPFVAGNPVVCAYQDGFFLLNESGTQKWWQSNLNDVFTWDALNFSSKDGQPDPIVAMIDNHREVWLFGSQTTEVWINGGLPGFSFQRLNGVFIQEGCAAAFSAAVAGTSVIWLSKSNEGQGVVMRATGYQAQRISTHAIEREIQSYGRIDDASAYTYQQEGHLFYVLTFPTADATWCFDVATNLWHQRASFENGQFHRHRSNCCAAFQGRNVVGDFQTGELYAFDLDAYDDAGRQRKWVRSWQAFPSGQITLNKTMLSRLQIYMQPSGVWDEPIRVLRDDNNIRQLQTPNYLRKVSGVTDPDLSNPQIVLRVSQDGGLSWGAERFADIGREGQTQHRIIWRRLGSARDPIFEISSSDPVKNAMLGAFLEATPGIS